jgi:hypothetical protein
MADSYGVGSVGEALDCSSFTSLALKRAGLFTPEQALTTHDLSEWGQPGEGRCVTVWALPGHVWLEFRLGDGRSDRFEGPCRPVRRTRAGAPPTHDAAPRHAPGL